MLTPEIITELKALLSSATPGPWAWAFNGDKSNGYGVGGAFDEDGEPVAGFLEDDIGLTDPVLIGTLETASANPSDPALIVELRNHAEELIAAAEQGRECAAALDAACGRMSQILHMVLHDSRSDGAHADVAALLGHIGTVARDGCEEGYRVVAETYAPPAECTCYEAWAGHQQGCPYYGRSSG